MKIVVHKKSIKINVFDRSFVSTPCLTNKGDGVKTELFYNPKICKTNVFNKQSINSSDNDNLSINIKTIKVTCQKNSFIELKMDFDKNVKEVIGLPQDMLLEKGYIKGTPKKSGDYLVIITFTDDSSYKFNINVPNLKRIY